VRQARKDVEGSLFVVKRRSQPRFQFVVLNQRSTGTALGSYDRSRETLAQKQLLSYVSTLREAQGVE